MAVDASLVVPRRVRRALHNCSPGLVVVVVEETVVDVGVVVVGLCVVEVADDVVLEPVVVVVVPVVVVVILVLVVEVDGGVLQDSVQTMFAVS
jgi:hypothetical protein